MSVFPPKADIGGVSYYHQCRWPFASGCGRKHFIVQSNADIPRKLGEDPNAIRLLKALTAAGIDTRPPLPRGGQSVANAARPTLLGKRNGAEAIKGECFVSSFVKTKHVLDGIHEGRFAVLIAI
jgi:hypothetical protein